MPHDHRPQFHFTTKSTWLNDPNGLIHHGETWHLFYQTNPHAPVWGNMSWGHATSTDLLTWKERPIALEATSEVEFFSGSCVFDVNNTSGLGVDGRGPIVAVFTENYTLRSPRHGVQAQGLAYSNDAGRTWTRYAGNPVLDRGSKDFRDPKVCWLPQHHYWLMTAVEAVENKVVFYRSRDLKSWTLLSEFGPANAKAPTWECPDMFPLQVEGTEVVKWVLVVSVNPGALYGGSGVQYFVGDFDGTTFTAPTSDSLDPRDYQWLDFGADYYAPITFNDAPEGRRIAMGWMSNWSYAHETPTLPWRGAMAVPREVTLVDTPDGYRVRQRPIHELSDRWSKDVMLHNTTVRGEKSLTLDLESGVFNVLLKPGTDECGLKLSGTVVGYKDGRLFVDRTASGLADFHPDFKALQWADVPLQDGALSLTVVLDTCSVEVFAQGGLYTITSLVFGLDDPDVSIYANGEVYVDRVTLLD